MSGRRLPTERLVRHVLGELTGEERDETEQRIADSRSEAERAAELRAMTEVLARPPAWVESVDLAGEIRDRIARGDGAPRTVGQPRTVRRWAMGGAGAVAVAAVAVLALGHDRPDTDGMSATAAERAGQDMQGVRSKGPGARAAEDPDRWVGIRLARATAGGAAVPVSPGDRIARGELQVSYTNLGPRPYSRLMVFAVDAAGQVRWLYPAYERADTDPEAIAIEPGAADAVLPDRIEHEFARGRLVVCGLFLRRPLTVRQVEAGLGGRQPEPGARLGFRDAGQHCFDLEAE